MSPNNEPSGVRLIRLINTQLLYIAKREEANRTTMCLYSTGTYWHGFEHSAYFLSRIFPDLESLVLNHPAYPFPIVGVSVPVKEFMKYKTEHIAILSKEDYEEFKVDLINTKEYSAWHQVSIHFSHLLIKK